MLSTVAIIGRANVGKSTLFNRMVGSRVAIVDDTPGVTRDRIYGVSHWLTRSFNVIDTGGIILDDDPFQEAVRAQITIAMEEADMIVFVVDGRSGITEDDLYIARMLKKSSDKVVVAVNKIDASELLLNQYEFYGLGFEHLFPISASQGVGTGDLFDYIIKNLPNTEENIEDDRIKFAIIGRPNVGKSSLVNAILEKQRVIVSSIEGTTRDAIDTDFIKDGVKYKVIDTAGLKRRGKISASLDRYSALRCLRAIERADVVITVIDGEAGLIEQDKHVLNYAVENGKGIIIAVNKIDVMEEDIEVFRKHIYTQMPFIEYAPIVFVSALTKRKIDQLFPVLVTVYESTRLRISTSLLNDVILDAQMVNPPTTFNNGILKISYANQIGVCPPTFSLFVNNPNFVHFSYQRFLENELRRRFEFIGTPLKFNFIKKN